jgi:hypothetical protein
MRTEYWATFSIYDHRTALYRQSLVLFDRIVIPIPTTPVGDLTNEEIDKLAKEADYLKAYGVALPVSWDVDAFAHWAQPKDLTHGGHQEGLARRLSGDKPYNTRLMLKEQIDNQADQLIKSMNVSVTAIPVYGSRDKQETSSINLKGYLTELVTLDIILKNVPMPAPDVSFDDILKLRDKPGFQASLAALRTWQKDTIRNLLADNDIAGIELAKDEFSDMIRKYSEALSDARFEKVTSSVVSILAVGAALTDPTGSILTLLAGIAAPLFSIKKLSRPCWKDLENDACFPAGVICEAHKLA